MILDKDALRKLAQGFAVVTEATLYSFAGLTVGYLLDRWIGRTKPWLTVVFTMLGLVGGFVRLYQNYMREQGKDADENDKKQ